MQPVFATVGPLDAANDASIAAVQSPGSGAIVLTANPVVLDAPRQVVLTSAGDDTGITFTIVGTTYGGESQTEVLDGVNGGTVATILNFLTVSSITASGTVAGAFKAGTTSVAGSRWVRLDSWMYPTTAIQADVTGSVNYTIQTTLDDPNSPTNPVAPVDVAWFNSTDGNVVNAIASKQSSFTVTPTFARVVLNSGTGSVTTTFAQFGNVPQ
jgi:hypothetical protein